MTRSKNLLSFAIVFLSVLYAMSCHAHLYDANAARSLVNDLQKIVKAPHLKSALLGVTIATLADGRSLFEYNAGKRLIPASNMKIVTTAAALITLTPDFRYSTALKTNGAIRSGILNGDLMIEGSGDPTISGYFNDNDPVYVFREWAKKLKEMGIKEIRGDLVIDNSIFSGPPYGEGWNLSDSLSCFCAPRDGFMFNNNCIQLDIVPSEKMGHKATTIMEPLTNYIKIDNDLKTARQNMVSLGYVTATSLKLTGFIRPDCPKKIYYVAVRSPAEFGGHVFRETLSSGGIVLQGAIRCARNCPNVIDISKKKGEFLHTLALYRSPRLAEIMKVVNKLSNNLYAEMLLVAMGNIPNQGTGGPPPTDIALAALARAGIDTAGIRMKDGSGLSRLNRITTRQLADILRFMAKGPYADYFYESLPIMSIDGTLGRRLPDSAATGKIRAKTGTIAGVRSLSGYLTTMTGENLVFSIIANNHESLAAVDKAIDRIMLRLLDYSAPKN